MCGIVGIIARKMGGLFQKDLDLFENGLVIDTLRGKDSCGAFTAFRNKQAMAIKHGSNPFEMFKTKEWMQFRNDAVNRGRFVIGHNRAATIGEKSTDNAHPFVEEHIILVHNGTIHNQEQLTTEKVAVDSNAIAHALVDNEPEEVFPYIQGAYACVWFDVNKQKLFMIRNDQRPLSLIETDDSWIISSEPWIMAMPAQRQERKLGTVTFVEPGDLYSFDMEGKYEVRKLDLTKKAGRPGAANQSHIISTTTGQSPSHASGTTPDTTTDIEDEHFFKEGTSETETTSPQVTLLRQALMEQRRRKMHGLTHSTSCALTQRVETVSTPISTTESASIMNSIAMNVRSNMIDGGRLKEDTEAMVGWAGPTLPCHPTSDDRDALNSSKDVITSPLYPPGRVVIFRVLKNTSDFKSRVRFQGKLMEPGMEMVDVQGFVPNGTMYMPSTMAIGRIFFSKVSVHGVEVFLTDIERCTYTPIHSTEVAVHYWNIAYKECQCDVCDSSLNLVDKPFTAVTTKAVFNKTRSGTPINTITCVCADCVQDKLPEGPYRETFIAKRRNIRAATANTSLVRSPTDPRPPVQAGVRVGPSIIKDADGTLRVSRDPTLH